MYKKLYCSDGIFPEVQNLLPKILKERSLFRIIISSIDNPLYLLASFLHIIKDNVLKSYSHIDNSFKLVEKLNDFYLNNNYSLISLDAISLFTNISF